MRRSMWDVVVKRGEDVRKTVVAANLPKCALAAAKMPRFAPTTAALLTCQDFSFLARFELPGFLFSFHRFFIPYIICFAIRSSFSVYVLTEQQHKGLWLYQERRVSRLLLPQVPVRGCYNLRLNSLPEALAGASQRDVKA